MPCSILIGFGQNRSPCMPILIQPGRDLVLGRKRYPSRSAIARLCSELQESQLKTCHQIYGGFLNHLATGQWYSFNARKRYPCMPLRLLTSCRVCGHRLSAEVITCLGIKTREGLLLIGEESNAFATAFSPPPLVAALASVDAGRTFALLDQPPHLESPFHRPNF